MFHCNRLKSIKKIMNENKELANFGLTLFVFSYKCLFLLFFVVSIEKMYSVMWSNVAVLSTYPFRFQGMLKLFHFQKVRTGSGWKELHSLGFNFKYILISSSSKTWKKLKFNMFFFIFVTNFQSIKTLNMHWERRWWQRRGKKNILHEMKIKSIHFIIRLCRIVSP